MLALLVLSANRVVSVDRLTDGLWGDDPPDGSAHALQVHVSRLRKALRSAAGGDIIVTRSPGYLLQVDPAAVDSVRFDALVGRARAEAKQRDHHRAAATLREALALWRGPALADVADAPGVRAEAVRLEEARLAALEERVAADLACGRHDTLVAELEALTVAHPLRERLWGQRMTALYRAGRQADALRAYQDVRTALVEELGLEPGPVLAQMESAILRRDPSLDLADQGPTTSAGPATRTEPPVPAGPGRGRTPFVGRASERAALLAALDRALDGSGGVVLVGGEPGIGKTRLAEETAGEAAGRGMRVLPGHCYERAGAPPYVAFVEILEQALAGAESPEAFVAGTLADAAPEIARLLPRLRRLFPSLPEPLSLPPEQERRYLFTCLSDVLARVAGACPTLIVLDDLQWADEPALLFLEHLGPRLPSLPLAVVATYRDAEVGPALARTFETLHRRDRAERLLLGGMAGRETGEIVRALAGQEPPPALVDELHAGTEGNPFFLEEVLRDLVEEGRLLDDDGRFRTDLDVGALAVPEGVRLVIDRRLERLSGSARRLLVAAAVAGRTFTFRLLEHLTGLDGDAVLDAIDEAGRAVLVREQPPLPGGSPGRPAEGEFLFAHELIRQTLVAGLSGPRRRRAHLRAAQAMIDIGAGEADERAAEIAHHLAAAGDEAEPGALVAWSVRAGRRALAASAHEEALAHLERAAALAAHAAGPAERAELYAALGSALGCVGRSEDALGAWERALEEFESLGDAEAVGRICVDVGLHMLWANRVADAAAVNRRGLAALGERVSGDRGRLLAQLASSATIAGDPVAGDAMYEEALRVSRQLGDEALRGVVLGEMAGALYTTLRVTDAVRAGTEGAAIMRAGADVWRAVTALGMVEICQVHRGRFAEASALGDEVRSLAQRIGNFPALFLDQRARGIQHFWQTGDIAALETFAREDVEFCERHLRAFVGHAYSRLGAAAFFRGDWPAAETWLAKGVANPPPLVPGYCWSPWFQYLAFSGRGEEARAFLEEHRPELAQPGQPNPLTGWVLLMALTEGLFVLGEREEPAGWYPLLLEAIGTGAVATDNYGGRLAQRVAGIAATATGDWDSAEGHFREALRLADKLPHQLERLETRRFYAAMLAERGAPGDAEETRRLLGEAVEGFTRLGMPRHAELARAALVSA